MLSCQVPPSFFKTKDEVVQADVIQGWIEVVSRKLGSTKAPETPNTRPERVNEQEFYCVCFVILDVYYQNEYVVIPASLNTQPQSSVLWTSWSKSSRPLTRSIAEEECSGESCTFEECLHSRNESSRRRLRGCILCDSLSRE